MPQTDYICTSDEWEILAGPIDDFNCWPSFVVRRVGNQPSLVYVTRGGAAFWRMGNRGSNEEAPFKIIKQEPYNYWIAGALGHHCDYVDRDKAIASLDVGDALFRARGRGAQIRGEIDYYVDGEWRRVGE